MNRIDMIKISISLIVIILLAVFIVNINKFIPQNNSQGIQSNAQQPSSLGSQAAAEIGNCFGGYGQSTSTVVFLHSNSCPHCQKMMPIIKELENEGYKFYWAEGSDPQAQEIASSCFSSLMSGYVPQFICPKTGLEATGEMSKDDLKKFSDDCKFGSNPFYS